MAKAQSFADKVSKAALSKGAKCPVCGTRNPGTESHCPECGSATRPSPSDGSVALTGA